MGQPVLSAALALAIAAILTAAVASGTFGTETRSRAVKLVGVVAVIAFAVVALQRADVRINFTGSMPIGIYLLLPLPSQGVKRGMIVAVCPPASAAKIGRERGYLASGPCALRTELLLKVVVAVGGDDVALSSSGVAVNGCTLPNSRPVSHDAARHWLSAWPHEYFLLPKRQIWLYADNARSWDSRYWGPAPLADIHAKAVPMLTLPVAPAPQMARAAAVMSMTCFSRQRRGGSSR